MLGQSLNLRADIIGPLLCALLVFRILLNLFTVIVFFRLPQFYLRFTVVDFLAHLVGWVLFIAWIYTLHSQLNRSFKRYPIKPEVAFIQTIIPFYNVWGIWDIHSRLADRMKLEGSALAELGARLRLWLVISYLTFFITLITGTFRIVAAYPKVPPAISALISVNHLTELFLVITWLVITLTILEMLDVSITAS